MERITQTYLSELQGVLAGTDRLDLLVEFFVCFSRFEFLLKKENFLQGEIGKGAEPDWNLFGTKLKQTYDELIEQLDDTDTVKEAATFIIDFPPKKQIRVGEKKVEFRHPAITHKSKTEILVIRIRGIRNNLFHGGKLMNHYGGEQREWDLIKSAVIMLSFWIENIASFRENFMNGKF